MIKKIKFIDLGLPSGILWADRNLGAKNIYNTGSYLSLSEALLNSGNVPRIDDFRELKDSLYKWSYEKEGIFFCGENNKSIFFPIGGYINESGQLNCKNFVDIWTSTECSNNNYNNLSISNYSGIIRINFGISNLSLKMNIRLIKRDKKNKE